MPSSDHGSTHSRHPHPSNPDASPMLRFYFHSGPSHLLGRKRHTSWKQTLSPKGFAWKNYFFLSDLKEISLDILKMSKKVKKIPPNEFAYQVIRTIALISLSLCPHSSHTLVFQHTGRDIHQSLCLGCPFLSALKGISSCLFNPQFGLFLLSFESFSILWPAVFSSLTLFLKLWVFANFLSSSWGITEYATSNSTTLAYYFELKVLEKQPVQNRCSDSSLSLWKQEINLPCGGTLPTLAG